MTHAESFNEERRVTYADIETREVSVRGSGPTIVFLHGFAHGTDAWLPVLQLLRDAGQAAVAVDLPGFGEADPLPRGELLPQLDSFVAAAIRHHGRSDGVVVVGNSLGAAAALRAARNTDLPVAAVMPIDVAGIAWTPLVARLLPSVIAAGTALSQVRLPAVAHKALVERALARGLYGRQSAVDPEVIMLMAQGFPDVATTLRMLRLGAKFKAELDRHSDHGGIAIPMTIVHGARDPLVPVAASRVLRDANPGSTLVVLENAGHCPQLDASRDIARLAQQLAHTAADKKEIS